MKLRPLWIGLGILALLAPLGLLASGAAWGEWGVDEVKELLGYVPLGLQKLSSFWKALIPDYAIPGWQGFFKSAAGYVLSAILGAGLTIGIASLLGKLLARPEKPSA